MSAGVLKIVQAILVLFALLSLGISLAGFYSYFFHTAPTNEGFVSVTGELEKYEKKSASGSGSEYLDIYLKGNPIRFRVGAGGYDNYFKSGLFYAAVKPGSKLIIEVEKKSLDNPNMPPRDPQKTVFVETLRDETNAYITWEDYLKWKSGDIFYALVIGVVFFIGTLVLTGISFLYLPKFKQPARRVF